jgi:UDP-N-acetylmuramate dehydrogenase
MPAGRLIQELGLKGARCGNAEVSQVHANFIVNPGRKATCREVETLIRRIREAAWRQRGVILNMEVETWQCAPELHWHPNDVASEVSV